jgi:hypothetical protein
MECAPEREREREAEGVGERVGRKMGDMRRSERMRARQVSERGKRASR